MFGLSLTHHQDNPAAMSRGNIWDYLEMKKQGPGRPIKRSDETRDRLPVRSLPSQTREGFYSHKVLGGIESGKAKGPIKLESGSAKGLAVKSAAHLKK